MKSLFVSYRGFLEPTSGGVQVCTREYIDVIEAAGIPLTIVPFEMDSKPLSRLKRLVTSSAYDAYSQVEISDRILSVIAGDAPEFIFLNQVALAPVASALRKRLDGSCKIVLLSHGLESTDLLHFIRLHDVLPLSGRIRPTATLVLGRTLWTEMSTRASIDLVCVLSPFDAQLEAWLGSSRTCWLPRRVVPSPLQWRPQYGRVGWVGTLDHAPNLDGLVKILDSWKSALNARFCVRLVGAPERTGKWLSDRYSCVDYLGALDDAALRSEASTWMAFVNPIFCQARGCSTKLATALGWHIPVVTTSIGRRGYMWSEGGVIEAATPDDFVKCCLELLDPGTALKARHRVIKAAETSPGTKDISQKLRAALELGKFRERDINDEASLANPRCCPKR